LGAEAGGWFRAWRVCDESGAVGSLKVGGRMLMAAEQKKLSFAVQSKKPRYNRVFRSGTECSGLNGGGFCGTDVRDDFEWAMCFYVDCPCSYSDLADETRMWGKNFLRENREWKDLQP
jgi:hypothetical protein